MFDRFTDSARQSMQVANREANHNGHQYIGNLHIFIAILDTDPAILDISGIDIIQLRNTANEIVSTTPSSGIKQTFEHALALNKNIKPTLWILHTCCLVCSLHLMNLSNCFWIVQIWTLIDFEHTSSNN